jgi:cytochrome c oxidase cbb3-type subunit 3
VTTTIIRAGLFLVLFLGVIAGGGCSGAPGRPQQDSEVVAPNKILSFDVLYSQNCAGCHGPNGAGGAALALANPNYLALADDATIRSVTASGTPGTMMPAFAESSGGMLTDEQINVLVAGMRSRWAQPNVASSSKLAPYRSDTAGDPRRGANVFAVYCSSCHGANGQGGEQAGSIVNGSYLSLVSDQSLRTTIIAGRPELGSPDSSSDVADRSMTSQGVSDLVAWFSAQRQQFPGQPYPGGQPQGGGAQ